MALTYQQSKLVRDTLPALREHGEKIASIFYKNMLRDHPELNDYFNTVNQKNGRQPRALTAVILAFAANINHTSELIPRLERMCNKHCSLGIKPEHYDIVGEYLLRAFGEVLGPAMTRDTLVAWTKAYWLLAKMMIGREAQLYKDFEKWTGWRKFKIDRVVSESGDIYSFHLVPQDGRRLPGFLPGQYLSIRVQVLNGFLQSRQYSLSDAYRPDHYRVSIKRDEGAKFSNSVSESFFHPGIVSNMLIDQFPAGSVVDVSHPAGEFFFNVNNSSMPLVLISAGVGATPLVSIANTVVEMRPGRSISWIHGSRNTIPFEDHIAELRRKNPSFRTKIFKTHLASGDLAGVTYDYDFRMDLAKVDPEKDLFLRHSGTEYYICGPEQFMLDISAYLKAEGVPADRLKCELFSTGDLAFKAAT